MSSRPYYYPRIYAQITVSHIGTTNQKKLEEEQDNAFTFPIRVRRFDLNRADHNQADSAFLCGEYLDLGLDPRVLRNCTCDIFVGENNPNSQIDVYLPKRSDLVFSGIAKRVQRTASEESGVELNIDFVDYTTLFLEHKVISTEFAPRIADTLTQAWASICDGTGPSDEDGFLHSTATALRTNLVLGEGVEDLVIGTTLPKRLQSLNPIYTPQHHKADNWALWKDICDNLGLITFIHLDKCHVELPRNFYTTKRAVNAIWGINIQSMNEERNCGVAMKGVAVNSFDPLTNSTLQVLYPPPGDPRVNTKKLGAKGKVIKQVESYVQFDYASVINVDRLTEIAKRIYYEFSAQDLEGSLKTSELSAEKIFSGGQVPPDDTRLVDLMSGDSIKVSFAEDVKTDLKSLGSKNDQITYLLQRGYSYEFAGFLVDNLEKLDSLGSDFIVKGLNFHLDTTETEGDCYIEIMYCSKINVEGDDADPEMVVH